MSNILFYNRRRTVASLKSASLDSRNLFFSVRGALCCFFSFAFFVLTSLSLYAVEEEQASRVESQERPEEPEYSRLGWTRWQRDFYQNMLKRGVTSIRSLRSKEESEKRDWESSDRLAPEFGFQVEYARRINYTYLLRDLLPFYDGFYWEMLKKLGEGEYEFVIEETKKAIKDNVEKSPPWDMNIPPDLEKKENLRWIEMLGNKGFSLNCLIRLLALALELNGEYDKAQIAYGLAYGADIESMTWNVARLNYERGLRDVAFQQVCEAVQEYHNDLKSADIDRTIDQVKTYEGLVREGRYLDSLSSGIPIGRDEKHNQDVAMLELYQIRRQLALFVNPLLDYSELAYCSDQYRQEPVNAAKHIVEIRNAYAKGVAFMEEEFQKEVEPSNPDDRSYWIYQHKRDTVELLRKMKELPY